MSGRKQHYIPQFLLRAFGRLRKGTNYQVRAHFKDRTFITATEGVAAEREFYSVVGPDSLSLDDTITAAESTYAVLHRNLLESGKPDPTAVGRLLAHLTIRGAHFRDSATYMASSLIELAAEQFQDPAAMRRLLSLDKPKPTGPFKEALDKKYNELRAKYGRMPMSRYEFNMKFHRLAQDRFPELYVEGLATNHLAAKFLLADLPNTAAEGQRKGLSKELEPQKRVDAYGRLRWDYIDSPGSAFLLPDSIAAVINNENRLVSPLYTDVGEEQHILFPISSSRLVIGYNGSISPQYSVSEINEMTASVSWNLFLSSPDSSIENGLELRIRSAIEAFLAEMIALSMANAIAEI